MNTIKQKQLDVLYDTINYFNANNRNAIKDKDGRETCQYAPINEKKQGCAIGRLINNKELCRELDIRDLTSVSNDDVFNKLPKELKELQQWFLIEIQELHDTLYYWNDTGLTYNGREYVNNLKKEIERHENTVV